MVVAAQKEVKVVRLVGSLGRDEDRVYFMIGCITKFTNLSKIDLADEEGEDFIGFGVVFFDIDVSAKKDNVLERNGLSYDFILVFGLIVCYVNQCIDIFFLDRHGSTLLNLCVWDLSGYLKSLTIFRVDRPVIVCSLYAILVHYAVFYSICSLCESLMAVLCEYELKL